MDDTSSKKKQKEAEKKQMEAKKKTLLEEQDLVASMDRLFVHMGINKNKPSILEDQEQVLTKPGKSVIFFEDADGGKDRFGISRPIGRCTVINFPVYAGVRVPHDYDIVEAVPVPDAFVTIKYVNRNEDPDAFLRLRTLADRMNDLVPPHPNLIGIRKPFINKGYFFVIFPFMEQGSLRSIMAALYPNGLPELCILIALRESLQALSYLHGRNHFHREINAAHIFLNAKREIKLAYSASVYEHGTNQNPAEDPNLTAVSISNWAAAPEFYESTNNEYTSKCDIWLVGITALELAYGGLRIENRAALNSMVEKINRKKKLPEKEVQEEVVIGPSSFSFRRLFGFKKRNFSKKFGKMVAKCLNSDPGGRPTADELLRSQIFELNKGSDYFYNLIRS